MAPLACRLARYVSGPRYHLIVDRPLRYDDHGICPADRKPASRSSPADARARLFDDTVAIRLESNRRAGGRTDPCLAYRRSARGEDVTAPRRRHRQKFHRPIRRSRRYQERIVIGRRARPEFPNDSRAHCLQARCASTSPRVLRIGCFPYPGAVPVQAASESLAASALRRADLFVIAVHKLHHPIRWSPWQQVIIFGARFRAARDAKMSRSQRRRCSHTCSASP